ncbi:hypothetical protein SAMN04488057_10497 [Cyclobacterium lianum]|uniref:Outer membrane protein beta-barrel domain-containing protein n=1 Tax=Cyclobacterium lianum TaxID=388280 RepID=A0A1M7M4P9_9BACT|nr:hypothetical protein [Cyclobacterium lianum]SHM85669.1 hypothetical protein SAMN04488057_10497 [Cyclobacterium lianum]
MITLSRKNPCALILLLVLCALQTPGLAQEDIFGIERKLKGRKSDNELGNVFRNVVSNFSFEFSAGAAYQEHALLFSSESPSNYPIRATGVDQVMDLQPGDTLSLKGGAMAYPVNLGLRINVFNFITVGAGYGREWGRLPVLSSPEYALELESSRYTYDKLYGTLGIVLWGAGKRNAFLRWQYRKYSGNNIYMQSELKQRARQIYPWRLVLEGEFGSMMLRQVPDPGLTAPDPYYGIGLRLEYDFSEYARAFVKPSASFRSFAYAEPEAPEIQSIDQNLYTLQAGISISLPGTKKCKVPGCRVVMKHLHNGVEYRGSSIWFRQNRKVGQW